LSATHVFKVYAVRSRGRGFVEKYRDAMASPYFIADSTGERDAIVERDSFDGNKRNNISRANSRMRALMDGQVNEFSGLAYTEQRGFRNGIRVASEGHDAAIVIGVHFAVKDVHAGYAAHGGNNRFNLCGIASFGKVRNALNQSGHI
jgi:hypothetical protein